MIETAPRRVFIVLSSRALAYAWLCIRTLLANSAEPIHLRLIVDDAAEAALFGARMADMPVPAGSQIEIVAKETVSDLLAERYPGKLGLRALHEGHPCWRKVIDPLVLSAPEDELIIADPDLFFPNRYSFEVTPQDGVMIMRMGPNCMFPPEAVRATFELGVRLANHVDIGVAQLRAGAVDIDWLDWFATHLDVNQYRRWMYIEAILWSAMAMRMGGLHLNPASWRCWERGHVKRLAVAAGVPGRWTLHLEHLRSVKCIHLSGPSKWWVTEALQAGTLKEFHNNCLTPSAGVPYRELTRNGYERERWLKDTAGELGYFFLTKSAYK